ncbi:CheR family methyltransferase [Methanogenium cariaci]|jgi:chemotaxis protein methyltransferase CheR
MNRQITGLVDITMDTREFQSVLRTIESKMGIQCANYKADYLQRRIQSRMRMNKIDSYAEYNSLVISSTKEQEALRNALTINVTKFWRDREVFDLIKSDVLPEIRRRKQKIRIWSAGCATGEEPYTLALMCHEARVLFPDVQVTIFASDIDREALKKAETGIYHRKALENLSESQIRRHFDKQQDGSYQVKQHLRDLVKFSRHDLMSGRAVTQYLDVILCRNVTIYFTEKQKDELARMFAPALTEGGYYVMGKTEYMGRDVEQLYDPYNPIQKIYQKKKVA